MTALGAASISCVIDHKLTSRSVPRYVQSMGTANSSAPVWLWSLNGLNPLTSRISKKVWNNTAGSGNPVVHSKFVYDGWNLCAEIDGLNPQPRTLMRSYVWGTDLSGSLQGAGGVGGLVKLTYHGTQTTNAFVAYDGNGNVAALFDASNNALLASYEYGPFGELIRATGPTVGSMAKLNPIRFSTKYQDDESEFVYYGYRYYNPSTGRWISRDRIDERGGLNLFQFVANNALRSVDPLGDQSYKRERPRSICCPSGERLSCDQICRMALNHLQINRDIIYGGVICFNRKVCPCVAGDPVNGWTFGECPQIDNLIVSHENEHAKKIECHKCGLYAAGPADLPDNDFVQEECEQRRISLEQFQIILPSLTGRCKDVAEGYIKNVSQWILSNCK